MADFLLRSYSQVFRGELASPPPISPVSFLSSCFIDCYLLLIFSTVFISWSKCKITVGQRKRKTVGKLRTEKGKRKKAWGKREKLIYYLLNKSPELTQRELEGEGYKFFKNPLFYLFRKFRKSTSSDQLLQTIKTQCRGEKTIIPTYYIIKTH